MKSRKYRKQAHWALHTAGSANVKAQNIFHGWNNITSRTNCKYRTAGTLCTVETWFVYVYKENTLHKGDNKDYDNDHDNNNNNNNFLI